MSPNLDVFNEWKLYLRRRIEQLRGQTYGGRGLMAWLSGQVGYGDLCFDVGANLGRFTDLFLRCGASVVSVEPQRIPHAVLKKLYSRNRRVSLERVALGRASGRALLYVGSSHTVASLSSEWMKAVASSGRFAAHEWPDQESVEMTTLDNIIQRYGKPRFCKIDVEGFEDEVLRGLTVPVPVITLEYTSEIAWIAVSAIRRLSALGPYRFNLSRGETGDFVFSTCRAASEASRLLTQMSAADLEYGNVIALLDHSTECHR